MSWGKEREALKSAFWTVIWRDLHWMGKRLYHSRGGVLWGASAAADATNRTEKGAETVWASELTRTRFRPLGDLQFCSVSIIRSLCKKQRGQGGLRNHSATKRVAGNFTRRFLRFLSLEDAGENRFQSLAGCNPESCLCCNCWRKNNPEDGIWTNIVSLSLDFV